MASEIVTLIDRTQDRFLKIAPTSMNFDAEKGFAVQLLSNSDYMRKAALESPESFLQAISNVAAIGLTLNPAEKLAYLIPRNTKVNNQWKTRVYLEPSYIGLIRLATNSGSIKWCQAKIVHKNDTFVDNGAGKEPSHTYEPFGERGDFVGCYCVAKTVDDDFLTTIMTKDEIDDIKNRSESVKSGKRSPWDSDFFEMCKKAVIRRAFKTWTRTDGNAQLAKAIDLSNENEGFEPILTSPSLNNYTAEQKTYFDQLIENADAWEMFLFRESIGESTWMGLVNSFERGGIGKYGKIINDMGAIARDRLATIVNDLTELCTSGDDYGITEYVAESTSQEIEIYLSKMSNEHRIIINSVIENQKTN